MLSKSPPSWAEREREKKKKKKTATRRTGGRCAGRRRPVRYARERDSPAALQSVSFTRLTGPGRMKVADFLFVPSPLFHFDYCVNFFDFSNTWPLVRGVMNETRQDLIHFKENFIHLRLVLKGTCGPITKCGCCIWSHSLSLVHFVFRLDLHSAIVITTTTMTS